MVRLTLAGLSGAFVLACAGTTAHETVGSVVSSARADQVAFVAKYQDKGLAFRGTVQSKGIKASTAVGLAIDGFNSNIQARRVNVNYGYLFLGDDAAQDKRALCLFEPEDIKQLAPIKAGDIITVTCLFSKFVGEQSQPTPAFWGCSVID